MSTAYLKKKMLVMSGTKAENYESCDSDGVSVKKRQQQKKVQLVW